ncbi:endonuclease/exonuclease/phosphatase family protein [Stackebrandtia sp.]|uniref:endonuclease/exonuclease/phosphatase family protein n=1 Tax=Stackebrandtia sp. TaxID=2023065 RepID=UPI0039C9F970
MWTRGMVPAALAAILAAILAFHSAVPNAVGNLGSLLDTFLPWLGWLILPLGAWAALRRSALAGAVLLLPVLVWAGMYAGLLPDKSDGARDLRVVAHNVNAANTDAKQTAATIVASKADVVALEEVSQEELPSYESALGGAYPYHFQEGTVGIWSRDRITDSGPVDIGIGWTRAIRATVHTDAGQVAVYVAHLASVRVDSGGFTSGQRDTTAERLGDAIAKERLHSVLLLGDLNGTMQDRSLAPLASQLESTQAVAGEGFGFTWPASFPMARIDQILVRGVTPVRSWTLKRTGSDHLPVAADVKVPGS